MWAIFKLNILLKMVSGQYGKDLDSFALMYAQEYDKCIKRGGDMIYGVPVMNGNGFMLIVASRMTSPHSFFTFKLILFDPEVVKLTEPGFNCEDVAGEPLGKVHV